MNHSLPSVTNPSLKHLLLIWLQAALSFYVSDNSFLIQPGCHNFLHLTKDNNRVLYVSAIAFQLSKAKNIPPLEIATALTTLLCEAGSSLRAVDQGECYQKESWQCSLQPHQTLAGNQLKNAANLFEDFTVQVVPPGWIHFELTEPKLAAWLQSLAEGRAGGVGEQESRGNSLPLAPHLFAVQYAHARCCSLMQLAHREGLITLQQEPDTNPAVFLTVAPDPIPWLNSDQKLRCCHPAERALVARIVELLDELDCPCPSWRKPVDWGKAALNLSQAFQTFYSCCRIWGETKIQTPHLAQVRLGLVIVTQSVLRLLLQDKLGIPAPLEL